MGTCESRNAGTRNGTRNGSKMRAARYQPYAHAQGVFSQIASGPSYTYFGGDHRTTVDYCLFDSWGAHLVGSCQTIEHHSLNFSDHLPLSIHVDLNPIRHDRTSKGHAGLNWRKARNDGCINDYSQRIHDEIRNLYVDDSPPTCSDEMEKEIERVTTLPYPQTESLL